jgi:hypothetical protein
MQRSATSDKFEDCPLVSSSAKILYLLISTRFSFPFNTIVILLFCTLSLPGQYSHVSNFPKAFLLVWSCFFLSDGSFFPWSLGCVSPSPQVLFPTLTVDLQHFLKFVHIPWPMFQRFQIRTWIRKGAWAWSSINHLSSLEVAIIAVLVEGAEQIQQTWKASSSILSIAVRIPRFIAYWVEYCPSTPLIHAAPSICSITFVRKNAQKGGNGRNWAKNIWKIWG